MSPTHLSAVPFNPYECQQGQKAGSIDIPLIITHNDNNMKLLRGHAWNILFLTFSFHFMAFSVTVRLLYVGRMNSIKSCLATIFKNSICAFVAHDLITLHCVLS